MTSEDRAQKFLTVEILISHAAKGKESLKNHNLSGPEFSHLVDDINMKSGIEAVNQQIIDSVCGVLKMCQVLR